MLDYFARSKNAVLYLFAQSGIIIAKTNKNEVLCMVFSYKKLWKLLIDKEMKKKDLCEQAGVSSATLSKMVKGESITTESLLKICVALKCEVSDIMEIVESPEKIKR